MRTADVENEGIQSANDNDVIIVGEQRRYADNDDALQQPRQQQQQQQQQRGGGQPHIAADVGRLHYAVPGTRPSIVRCVLFLCFTYWNSSKVTARYLKSHSSSNCYRKGRLCFSKERVKHCAKP